MRSDDWDLEAICFLKDTRNGLKTISLTVNLKIIPNFRCFLSKIPLQGILFDNYESCRKSNRHTGLSFVCRQNNLWRNRQLENRFSCLQYGVWIPVSRSFIHSFIQLVWRLFHYTALSVVFSGRENHWSGTRPPLCLGHASRRRWI